MLNVPSVSRLINYGSCMCLIEFVDVIIVAFHIVVVHSSWDMKSHVLSI